MTLEQQIESFFQTNFKFYSITDLQKKFCLLPKEETVLQTILLNLESQGYTDGLNFKPNYSIE